MTAPRRNSYRLAIFGLSIICALLLCACASDGGTSGTGVRSISGGVLLPNAQPLAQASVTLLESGDSSITDAYGAFSIETELDQASPLTLQVEGSGVSAEVPLPLAASAEQDLAVELTVDPQSDTGQARLIDLSSVQEFELDASVVGACDRFFENRPEVIRQANHVKDGTVCVLKASVVGDHELVGGVNVTIERQACDPAAAWHSVASGITATGVHRGKVQIEFSFADNEDSCRYRISAPFNDAQGRADSFKITTLTEQERQTATAKRK